MSISLQHFREILTQSGVNHVVDEEHGLIMFDASQTSPIPYRIKFVYTISEEQKILQAHATLGDYDLDETDDFAKARRFCNEWNANTVMIKAYVDESGKMILCEWAWDTNYEIPEAVSRGAILANFIENAGDCIRRSIAAELYPAIPHASAVQFKR